MALERQLVPVPFAGGVDTKTDPKQLGPAKLTVLENGVFTSPGRIKKRNGFARLTEYQVNADTFTGRGALFTFRDELLATDGSTLSTYIGEDTTWLSRGTMPSVQVTQEPVARDDAQNQTPDVAIHPSGCTVYAWQDSTNNRIRYSILDTETGAVRVAGQSVGTPTSGHTVSRVKCAVVGRFVVIFWLDRVVGELGSTQTLQYITVNATSLAASSPATAATLKDNTTPCYDVAPIESAAYFTWNAPDSGGTRIGVQYFYDTGSGAISTSSAAYISDSATRALAIFQDLTRDPWGICVAWGNSSGISYALLNQDTSSHQAPTVADADTTAITAITGVSNSADLWLGYTFSTAEGLTRTRSLIANTVADVRGVSLGAKPFVYADTLYNVLVYKPSSQLQTTYFVVDRSGNVVAKMLYGLAGNPPGATLAETLEEWTGHYLFPALIKTRTLTQAESIYLPAATTSSIGINAMHVSFLPTDAAGRAEIADTLHITGGFLRQYDGARLVEHGFHLYPEPVSVPGASGAYSYEYAACYEWTDNRGHLHRSAPSAGVNQKQAAAIDGSHTVTVTIPTLRLTAKSNVQIVVYRSENGGTTLYRVGSVANSTSADTVTFTDDVEDTVLTSNESLYTTGDVLQNIAPNPCTAATIYRNRLVVLDSLNPLVLWHSKAFVSGEPLAFSDFLTITIDEAGGNITALATLDDKLVVFKEDRLFVVTGQGPDDRGAQNDFIVSPVNSPVGCNNHRSVVTTPAGVMFQSPKGIYLLDRSLQVSYIGAPVESYNGQRVTSAQMMPDSNQVRLMLEDPGGVLVYDVLVGQWSTFTNINALDSVMFEGRLTWIASDGWVREELDSVYADEGVYITLRLVTGWIQVAALQGFQRLRRILVLGSYKSAHELSCSIAYDYATSTSETVTGTQSTAGAYQWSFQPARQKCESVQITLQDVHTTTNGESLDLSALTFEVGVKKGSVKLPAAKGLT